MTAFHESFNLSALIYHFMFLTLILIYIDLSAIQIMHSCVSFHAFRVAIR